MNNIHSNYQTYHFHPNTNNTPPLSTTSAQGKTLYPKLKLHPSSSSTQQQQHHHQTQYMRPIHHHHSSSKHDTYQRRSQHVVPPQPPPQQQQQQQQQQQYDQQKFLKALGPIASRSAGNRSMAAVHYPNSSISSFHRPQHPHHHHYHNVKKESQLQEQPVLTPQSKDSYNPPIQTHQNLYYNHHENEYFDKHKTTLRKFQAMPSSIPPPPPPSNNQTSHFKQDTSKSVMVSMPYVGYDANTATAYSTTNNLKNNPQHSIYIHPSSSTHHQQIEPPRSIINDNAIRENYKPDHYQQLLRNETSIIPNSSSSSSIFSNNESNQKGTFIGIMTKEVFIDVLTCYINNLIERNEKAQLLLNTSPTHSHSDLDVDLNNNDYDNYNKHNDIKSRNYSGHNNSNNSPIYKIKKLYQCTNNPSPTSIINESSPCTSSSSSSHCSSTYSPNNDIDNKIERNNNDSNNNNNNKLLPNHLQPESVFFSITKPTISTFSYIKRIVLYTQCSPSVFIIMLIYLNKIGKINHRLKVTNYNLHRLLITSLMLACKWVDDITFTMQHYGKIGGIPTSKEMERLEIQFLKYLNFNMHVPVEEYYTMQHDLDSLALNIM